MTETDRIRRLWDKNAHKYDKQISFCEKLLFQGDREWVCGRAEGDVLEVAIGTGRNLPYYPQDVTLTGIELSPAMLEIARDRARNIERSVDLRLGDAQKLEFPGARFDTVVSTLTMCNIPDYRTAIAEIHRVLKPGGRLVMAEHVRSDHRAVRFGQRLLNPLMVRFEGDHLLRDPHSKVLETGFVVEEFESLKWGIVNRIGARKPV